MPCTTFLELVMSQEKTADQRVADESSSSRLAEYWQRLEGSREFFWVFDPAEYCFVYIGADYARIWNRPRKELYDSAGAFFEGIHPEDRPRIHQAFCSGSSSTYNELYRVQRADGSERWVRDRAFPMLDGKRRVEHISGVASDVTELILGDRSDEVALQPPDERPTIRLDRTQRQYRRLFDESADACVLLDLHGYIIEANRCAAKIIGFDQHSMVRMHFSSFCPSDTLSLAVDQFERATSGQTVRFTTPLLRRDGSTVTTEIAAELIDFGPEYVVQLGLRDVTPRQRMADELEAARDQLARAQKMELVGQLAGGITHDFNNLLSVIISCTQFIREEVGEDSPILADTDKILRASDSAASLVRRLLTFARQEVAQPELVEPALLLRRVRPLIERTLPSDITFTLEIDEGLHALRLAPVELEQIIMNLGINARDAMPDGGELRIEASNIAAADASCELAEGRYMRVRITDTGVGMDERTRSRIFEPFFTTKPKDKGTGLGLPTVLNLVEQNHGTIHVDSQPGEGSAFELYFPHASSGQHAADASAGASKTPSVEGKTILAVDDDADVRELLQRILETAGYTVLLASDGRQALDLLDEHGAQVNLLLTDVMMPDIDGPGLVERSRPQFEDLVIVYTSGQVDDPHTRRSLREGGAHFIAKPFTRDGLLTKINDILAQAHPPFG